MDVSVIIVNYNVRDFLNNALVSLQKSLDGIASEILVVDNASDDGSVEHIAKNFPAVRIIANQHNDGFAKGNNLALAQAAGKYILLINPDTVVQEDTVHSMIDFFEKNPHAGMAGCKILNADGTLQLACRRSFPTPWVAFTKTFGLSSFFPKSDLFARYNLTFRDPEKTYEVEAISGSFMMIRREIYENIGGFDESFFMYGEDLDWCFRVRQAGWKVYYVPTTSIIHYKGESTKRSDIDELRIFYTAMKLFVHKHHTGSSFFEWFIYLGIFIRKMIAGVERVAMPLLIAIIDASIINATILLGEYIRKHEILTFPQYAYPWIYIVPSFIVVSALFINGVYTERKLSISRSFIAVFIAYIIISSITAFVKEFAFSRMIIVVSGIVSVVSIPGWRLMMRMMGFGQKYSRTTLFGKRTVIVGVNQSGQEIIKKLRAHAGGGYEVVGFIDSTRIRIGEKISNVEIIGSIETLRRVIEEYKISEVIFASDAVPYSAILKVIASNKNRFVNFRMVPNTLEVIIGKSNIDQLDEIPFIDIEYNIAKPANRVVKRLFDIIVGLLLLICVSPFVYFSRIFISSPPGKISRAFIDMPKVVWGSMSLVGFSLKEYSRAEQQKYLNGKPGITGLMQIYETSTITSEEKQRYELYYAKNQSFLLDLEILIKSFQKMLQH